MLEKGHTYVFVNKCVIKINRQQDISADLLQLLDSSPTAEESISGEMSYWLV